MRVWGRVGRRVAQEMEDDDAMPRRALERGRLAYERLVMDVPVNMEQKCALVRGMAKSGGRVLRILSKRRRSNDANDVGVSASAGGPR